MTEDEEIEAGVAMMQHVPDRDEIASLLERYFVGPITSAAVDDLTNEFRAIHGRNTANQSHFESPTQWRGMAWNEEFSDGRKFMTPCDEVLMLGNAIANHDPTFPRPKLYCPPHLVGTWRQVEPSHAGNPYLWTLAANGAFTSDSSDVPGDMRWWCAQRIRGFTTDQVKVVLRVEPRWGSSLWTCNDVERVGDELVGVHVGYMRQLPVRLRLEPKA